MRYTECKMAPLAMEMVRDIDEDTVDFRPNYDGRRQEPASCSRRGSRTCWSTARPASRSAWPPTSRRTTCARSTTACSGRWRTPRPTQRGAAQDALLERIKGPDFPMGALIVGTHGHRGGLPHRPRLGHDARDRRRRGGQPRTAPAWSITQLPYHGQPRQPGAEDRRARRLRPGPGHRRRARRLLVAHRSAAGRRAQARRGRPRGAQQPLQAHRAAARTSAATCWRSSTTCRAR